MLFSGKKSPTNVHTIVEPENLEQMISSLPKGTLLLLDVDSTIIETPDAHARKHKLPEGTKGLIGQLKDELKDTPDRRNEVISQWRLQREVILVHPRWPEIIENAKKNGVTVFALTNMETGKLGQIDCMEKWRFEELQSKGIHFSNGQSNNEYKLNNEDKDKGYALFYHGLILTGVLSGKGVKPNALEKVIAKEQLSPTCIAFVDDIRSNIDDIKAYAESNNIPFEGIHWRGCELIPGEPNEEIMAKQKEQLLTTGKWLSDEQVVEKFDIKTQGSTKKLSNK